MELIIIWEIICRRKWIIIQAFVIIFLVSTIGSFLVRKFRPTYRATARLFIATDAWAETSLLEGVNLRGIARFVSTESVSGNPIETQIALITAKPIIERLIRKVQLKDKKGQWLKAEKLTKSTFIPKVFPVRRVTVEQYEDTDLLEISAESGNSKEAMEMVNILADIYIEEIKKLSQAELAEINKFVDKEIEPAKQRYADALNRLREFKEAQKTISLDKEVNVAIEKLAELNRERESSLIRLHEVKVKLNTVRDQLKEEVEATISAGVVTTNPQIESLKKQLVEQQLLLSSLRAERTEEHPEVVGVLKAIAKLKRELAEELAVHRKLSPELKSLEQEIAAEEIHLEKLDGLVEEYSKLLLELPAREYELASLQLMADTAREIYNSLLEYHYQIGITSAISFCNVRIVAPAELPTEPSKPNIVVNAVLGIFLGIMVGLGLGFLSEYVDDTVKDADDVKEHLKLSLLGVIPLLSKKSGIVIGGKDTPIHLSDTFWRISHNIKIAGVDKEIKSFLVTSSGPNEGKTITASNLGIAFAESGKKALLVDADLFRPGISGVFEVAPQPGLTEVLTGDIALEKALRDSGIEGLTLLMCGECPPNAGRFLESEKMRDLVDELANRFDIVIYDTAPVLAATETVVLASEIRNSVLVVEAEKTSRKPIAQAVEMLKNVKADVLGIVLNKCRIGKTSYYYHYR